MSHLPEVLFLQLALDASAAMVVQLFGYAAQRNGWSLLVLT